jgi:hypothetical protein
VVAPVRSGLARSGLEINQCRDHEPGLIMKERRLEHAMTTLNEGEQALAAEFVHDEEAHFRRMARRDKLCAR